MILDAATSVLRLFPAETAHLATIRLARTFSPVLPTAAASDVRLAVRAFGRDFPNPLGLAAGFDKNADVPDAMLKFGFGFVECGTVTPRPQPGNPRPRLFRLSEDRAVINRMGFNNEGMEAVAARLAARRHHGIVGINIGANKDSDRPHRRLPRRLHASCAARRLRHDQRLVAQHAGTARPAKSRRTDPASGGGDAGAREHSAIHSAAAEDRARSRCACARRYRRSRDRLRHRRADRLQHHHRAAGHPEESATPGRPADSPVRRCSKPRRKFCARFINGSAASSY